jgi:hypothetical protein
MRAFVMTALVTVPTLVFACSSSDAPQTTGTIKLELKGDGTNVFLTAAPLNKAYAATYPVKDVQHMTVIVDRTGDIQATCETSVGVAPCVEHPFFTQVRPYAGRIYIKMFDVFGEKIAGASACEPDGDAGNCDNTSDGGDTGDPPEYPPAPDGGTTDFGDSGGGTGHTCDSGNGNTPPGNTPPGNTPPGNTPPGNTPPGNTPPGDNPPGSTPPGSGPQCDAASVAAAQQKFCQEVDAWLQAHNINYTLNCSVLNGVFDYRHAHPPEIHQNIPCMEIIQTAWDEVHAEFQGCSPDVVSTIINWKSSSRWDLIQHGTCRGSPLVLDLDGDGVNLTSLGDGVAFDLFGTGEKVKTAWLGGGDGWLVLDRNGNGVIDGARELFGNVTAGAPHADGFEALATIDDNGDGRIDANDADFAKLRVWRDANKDGRSQPSELVPLATLGIRALLVNATRDEGPASWDRHGNQIPLVGAFERDDGTRGIVADAYLRFTPLK